MLILFRVRRFGDGIDLFDVVNVEVGSAPVGSLLVQRGGPKATGTGGGVVVFSCGTRAEGDGVDRVEGDKVVVA